ncbi:hypothetical protein E2L05_18395 [Meridianimarinicoccus aquatilis]|uniref:Sulfate transporter family protein n=1 Tax=Meridianimarinicoccus aquatilis TaxID=2552766 RepID=A0A4R6AQT5_9RHOB|nr:hypothetical protein E2L05_18395 [Fluviibacterium aquatile]
MILSDLFRAVGQIGDPAFRRVLFLGLGLTLLLLVGAAIGAGWLVAALIPESISLPWVGEIGFLDNIASGVSVLGVLALSVVLMVPVASAFTGLFLDDVADAVEARHYPGAGPVRRQPFLSAVADTFRFLGLMIVANLCALVLYLIFAPLAPVIFWGLNGFLLGREYFQLVAIRRMDEAAARKLRRRNSGQIWLAGALMAIPLTVPVLNLFVPILGAAMFTHVVHRLSRNPR